MYFHLFFHVYSISKKYAGNKEWKFNIEAKIYIHPGTATVKLPCENIEDISEYIYFFETELVIYFDFCLVNQLYINENLVS